MKGLASTITAVVLLLGLGALAVLARGGGNALLPARTGVAVAAQGEVDGAAVAIDAIAPTSNQSLGIDASPDAVLKYNDISMVLTMSSVTDAKSLASYVGSSVKRVLRFNSSTQTWQTYLVGNDSTNYSIATGNALFLLVDLNAPQVLSLVGDVPAENSVYFNLVSGTPPKYNFISMPLDKANLTTASSVASNIGTAYVSRVLRWRSETQSYETYITGNSSTDFSLGIGEPFVLLLKTGAPSKWP